MGGLMSLTPGMSAAVNTATTPGRAHRIEVEMAVIRAWASLAGDAEATCSRPAGSGMSSI